MDAINKPAHYNQGPIECIDAMQIVLTPGEYRGFLKGNAIKYLWREENKGGIEDLRKARWYLDRLIEHCDESLLDANKGLVKAWTCKNGKAKQVYPEQPQPPDGYRWLEVGEVIRNGDLRFKDGLVYTLEPIMIGKVCQEHWMPIVRRNKFEVGEKVVHGDLKSRSISTVKSVLSDGWVDLVRDGVSTAYHVKDLAPYIEDAKHTTEVAVEVAGEVKNPLGCPDGWRWIEVGEVICKGDKYFKDHEWYSYDVWVGVKIAPNDRPSIRRNKFEVGEKVVDCRSGVVFTVQHFNKTHRIVFVDGVSDGIESKHFAPYIEEAT